MPDDEILQVIDDVFDNGDEIPAKVSNRFLLAAIRKNYRISERNSDALEKLVPRLDALEEHTKRHCDDLKVIKEFKDNSGKYLVAIIIGMSLIFAVVGWHTGVDFGWFPAIP